MRLRADEHLTVRRALRPRLHGESADVVRNLAETAPSTVSADVASSEDEVWFRPARACMHAKWGRCTPPPPPCPLPAHLPRPFPCAQADVQFEAED